MLPSILSATAFVCCRSDHPVTPARNRNFLLAEGFHRTSRQSNSWSLFLRYQAQAERLFRRALRLSAIPERPEEPRRDSSTLYWSR